MQRGVVERAEVSPDPELVRSIFVHTKRRRDELGPVVEREIALPAPQIRVEGPLFESGERFRDFVEGEGGAGDTGVLAWVVAPLARVKLVPVINTGRV